MIKYLEKNFTQEVSGKRILVDFYADWCGPCRMMGDVLENLQGIEILKVNVDKFPEIAQQYGVMSIPTLFLMDNGQIIKSSVGFMNQDDLESFIK